jgi:UDP-glucose 4-epimerase
VQRASSIKSLVVGANSILGRELIGRLQVIGERVDGVYHRQKNNLAPGITNYAVDELGQLEDVYERIFIISAFVPDRSLARGSALTHSLFDANVSLVNVLCEKFPSAKIVYTSSVSVYSMDPTVKNENSACGPASEYGVSKLWGEKIVGGQDRYAIVRVSSLYGIGMKWTTFLPFAIDSALKKNAIELLGDGARTQNYIQVRDAANCLYLAAGAVENGIFLASAAESFSNLQIAGIISSLTGCPISFNGQDPTPSSYYDNQRTRELTGFRPEIDLANGINELIEWKRKMSS